MEIFSKDEIKELIRDAIDTVDREYIQTGEIKKPADILFEIYSMTNGMLDALEEEKDREFRETVERLNEQLRDEQDLITGK